MKKTILFLAVWLWLFFGNVYGQSNLSNIKREIQVLDYSCNENQDCKVLQANSYWCCWWSHKVCASKSNTRPSTNEEYSLLRGNCDAAMCTPLEDTKITKISCECK